MTGLRKEALVLNVGDLDIRIAQIMAVPALYRFFCCFVIQVTLFHAWHASTCSWSLFILTAARLWHFLMLASFKVTISTA